MKILVSFIAEYFSKVETTYHSNHGILDISTVSVRFQWWRSQLISPLALQICISELGCIGSGNGLSLIWRQAITWTSAALLSIVPLRMNFSWIWIAIKKLSFMKMDLKILSAKRQPEGDELKVVCYIFLVMIIQQQQYMYIEMSVHFW